MKTAKILAIAGLCLGLCACGTLDFVPDPMPKGTQLISNENVPGIKQAHREDTERAIVTMATAAAIVGGGAAVMAAAPVAAVVAP
jgi:hypothetical protein